MRRMLGVALLLVASLVGCGGEPPAPGASMRELSVDEFSSALAQPERHVINVHVPYEGEISGTEAHIPFHAITSDPRLPADRATPLLLYCRSGSMSLTAGAALIEAGYTDVVHLDGGMQAWEAAGRPLVHE